MPRLTELTKAQIIALCTEHGAQTDDELTRALALAAKVRRRRRSERALADLHARANAAGADFAAQISAKQADVDADAIGDDE